MTTEELKRLREKFADNFAFVGDSIPPDEIARRAWDAALQAVQKERAEFPEAGFADRLSRARVDGDVVNEHETKVAGIFARWGFEQGRGAPMKPSIEEIERAVFHALLETTAWMGIPESKRMRHIEQTMGNFKAFLRQGNTYGPSLSATVHVLAEALRFYADEKNWTTTRKDELHEARMTIAQDPRSYGQVDRPGEASTLLLIGGKRAEEALKETGVL